MEHINEYELLKTVCQGNEAEAKLIRTLLRINKDKSLLMRRNGIRSEVEEQIDLLVKKKVL